MKTLSGIEMMTVGEIIIELRKFSPNEVFRITDLEGKPHALKSITEEEEWLWTDDAKGTVTFRDPNGKVVLEYTIDRDNL